MIGNLFRRGCDVVHPGTARVHVSGHGSQDDLVELLQRVRPRYLVPVHGEYRMLAQHARLAVQAGLPADRVLVAEDGDVLRSRPERRAQGGARRRRPHPARPLAARTELEDVVVRDRRHLSSEGIVVPVVVLGQADRPARVAARDRDPRLRGRRRGAPSCWRRPRRLLAETVDVAAARGALDPALTRERVRDELRRFFKRRTQRRPMVIPVVMEV